MMELETGSASAFFLASKQARLVAEGEVRPNNPVPATAEKGKTAFASLLKQACQSHQGKEASDPEGGALGQETDKGQNADLASDGVTASLGAEGGVTPFVVEFSGDNVTNKAQGAVGNALVLLASGMAVMPEIASAGLILFTAPQNSERGDLSGLQAPEGDVRGPSSYPTVVAFDGAGVINADGLPVTPGNGTGILPPVADETPQILLVEGPQVVSVDKGGGKGRLSGDTNPPVPDGVTVSPQADTKGTPQIRGFLESASQQPVNVKDLILAETCRAKGLKEPQLMQEPKTNTDNTIPTLPSDSMMLAGKPTDIQGLSKEIGAKNPVPFEKLVDQVVRKLDVLLTPERSEVEMVLKPEILGKLTIKLSLENHQVTARFMAENQQVKQVLEVNLPQLKAALEAGGLKLDRAEVGLYYQGGQDFQGQSGFHQQRAPTAKWGYEGVGAGLTVDEVQEEQISHYPGVEGSSVGVLDYVV